MFSIFHGLKHRLNLSLYLVTEKTYVKNNEELFFKIAKSIEGGVTCVQIRDRDRQNCLKVASFVKKFTDSKGIPLIINNHLDIALAIRAGLHIGQKDVSYREARHLLGQNAIIGLTVNTLDDVIAAQEWNVDYLGVQVFRSKNTKPEQTQVWGIEGLKQVRSLSSHRLVAIGGITRENLSSVSSHLIPKKDGIAMVGSLLKSENPDIEAKKIRALW